MYGDIWKRFWRASAVYTLALLSCLIVAAAMPLVLSIVAKIILDLIASRLEHSAGVESLQRSLLAWILLEALVVVTLALAEKAMTLLQATLSARVARSYMQQVVEKAARCDLKWYDSPEFMDQLAQAKRESLSRPGMMVQHWMQLARSVLTGVGCIVIAATFRNPIVVMLLVACLPAFIIEMKNAQAIFRLRQNRSENGRLLSYLESLMTSEVYAKEARMLVTEKVILRKIDGMTETLLKEDTTISFKMALVSFLAISVATLSFYGGYIFSAFSAARGEITVGQMTLNIMILRQAQVAMQVFLSAFGSVSESRRYMDIIYRFLARELRAKRSLVAARTPEKRCEIVVENISFAYPGMTTNALNDISFAVKRGEMIGFIGTNGSGKSTLVKVLTGLYEPTNGKIFLGGVDRSHLAQDLVRERFAVLFQDFNRYHLTARENVALGNVGRWDDSALVARAAALSSAGEVITPLKKGMHTRLGRQFSDGHDLSGGQWQRLALARMFTREEADFVILDEPTALLDVHAEKNMLDALAAWSANKATIVISHSVSVMRNCRDICVLENGRIVERGTFGDLLAMKGRFREIYDMDK